VNNKENGLKSNSSENGFNGDRNVAAEAKVKVQFVSFLASTRRSVAGPAGRSVV
jgi:hypothetical protein